MNEDVFNASIRKFLKALGVTAQREIEKAVRQLLPRDQRRNRAGISRASHGLDAGGRQSTVTPLALIGVAHPSTSLLTNGARYSCVARCSGTITAPSPSRRSLNTGRGMQGR